MKTKNEQYEKDKNLVLAWFRANCYGFRNARNRADILREMREDLVLRHIGLRDRYFRKIVSELSHKTEVLSCASLGYWYVPTVAYRDKEEVEAAKRAINERKKKAISMIEDCDQQIRRFENERKIVTNEQPVFAF